MNDSCQRVSPLLPYLAVGSLDGNERYVALHHVHTCASCRRELAFLTKLATEATNAWSPASSPLVSRNVLDSTLRSLHQQLDKDTAQSGQTTMFVESQSPILGYILENNVSPFSVISSAFQVVRGAVKDVVREVVRDAVRDVLANSGTGPIAESFEEIKGLGQNWLSWFQIGT